MLRSYLTDVFPLFVDYVCLCEIHSPDSIGNTGLCLTKPVVVRNGKIINILAKKKVEH